MRKPVGKALKPAKKGSPPALDLAAIVNEISALILRGASEGEVLAESARRWPQTEVRPLVVAAVQSISAAAEFDPSFMLGYCIQATREIHGKAMKAGELDTALRAVKLLADLTDR